MTGRPIGRQTIVRLRASTTTDRHGNAVRDWTTATAKTIRGCSVDPSAPAEMMLGRDADKVGAFVMAPIDADIVSSDRIRFGGRDYDVYGQPNEWPSPTGRLDYLGVVLQRWEG